MPITDDELALIKQDRLAGKTAANRLAQDNQHKLDLKKVELGILGKFFGSSENAPFYVAGVLSLGFLILISLDLIVSDASSNLQILIPGLLAIVGYMFGRGMRG